MTEYVQLKYYFGKDLAILLAEKIEPVYASFPTKQFVNRVAKQVEGQELKARVEIITGALAAGLPSDYCDAVDILSKILGPENKSETGMFKHFYWLMPVALFVEKYGLEHFQVSIKMIEHITKRNTGEYAIRPYILNYPAKTLKVMQRWSKSKNVHLRHLASEGLRPRLPWAKKMTIFVTDPSGVEVILENLKSDSSMFVKKSLANHLNDLLKENYPYAIVLLERWHKNASAETQWIIKHALRNEIKKQNPEALRLINQ